MNSLELVNVRVSAGLYPVYEPSAPVEMIPVPIDHDAIRLDRLLKCFRAIACGSPIDDPEVLHHTSESGNIRLIIDELAQLQPPIESEIVLSEKRDEFIKTMRFDAKWHHRSSGDEDDLKVTYVDAVISKVETHIDATTIEDALCLLQVPSVLKRASFNEDTEITPETFASNHLAVLMDILLKEHVKLRETAFEQPDRKWYMRLLAHRAFRLTVASGLFTASLVPKLHVVPVPEEWITEGVEVGLRGLTAGILGIDLFKLSTKKASETRSHRIVEERKERFAADFLLCDTALLIAYNSSRAGENTPGGRVTGRSATTNPKTNLERLEKLNAEFHHLNNDPGGKPYNADQALAFVDHVTAEFKDEVSEILLSNGDSVKQKTLFLDLARKLMERDIHYLRHRIRTGRFMKLAKGGASVLPMLLFQSVTVAAAEARTITKDTMEVVPHRERHGSRHGE
jgi:hypothetical protein